MFNYLKLHYNKKRKERKQGQNIFHEINSWGTYIRLVVSGDFFTFSAYFLKSISKTSDFLKIWLHNGTNRTINLFISHQ